MTNWISLDLFNLVQITGIVLALLFAIGLERSNKKLHADNQRRKDEDDLAAAADGRRPLNANGAVS